MRLSVKQIGWLKVALHLAGFLPLVWLFWAGHQGYFSADPAKDIQHFTGRMALKFLLATLLITPLARYAKQPLLIRTRRLLGYGALPGPRCTSPAIRCWSSALTIWRYSVPR